MRTETVEVFPAQVEHEAAVREALRELTDAEAVEAKAEKRAEDARANTARRRRELGLALIRVRTAWPERGPKSKGWGEFLAREGIEQSTAWRLMNEAGHKEVSCNPEPTHEIPPRAASSHQGHTQPTNEIAPLEPKLDESVQSTPEPVANVHGGSGEVDRGSWCTPTWITEAVGRFNVDPFSNPRSTVQADVACWIERGDNGLVTADRGGEAGVWYSKITAHGKATANTKVWIQPPYDIVLDALAHYLHTRFCALLRFDPSTKWFAEIHAASELILVTRKRVDFQPPRGVLAEGEKAAGAPFPHALFYAHAEDATPAIRELCFEWTTNNKKAT